MNNLLPEEETADEALDLGWVATNIEEPEDAGGDSPRTVVPIDIEKAAPGGQWSTVQQPGWAWAQVLDKTYAVGGIGKQQQLVIAEGINLTAQRKSEAGHCDINTGPAGSE